MKKLFLGMLAVCLLIGCTMSNTEASPDIQVSIDTSPADDPPEESGTSSESPGAFSVPAAENSTSDENLPADALEKPNRIVLVGDSRTMHLGYYLFELPMIDDKYVDGVTPDGDYILGIGGVGYSWLAEHTSEIEEKLTEGCSLVVNMGVNGAPDFHRQIAEWCGQMAAKYADKGVKVYFMSVNPVNDSKLESHHYLIRNTDVIFFNSAVRAELKGVTYIDTYSVVENDILGEGNGTSDGLHYNSYVCRKIWDHAVEVIRKE